MEKYEKEYRLLDDLLKECNENLLELIEQLQYIAGKDKIFLFLDDNIDKMYKYFTYIFDAIIYIREGEYKLAKKALNKIVW